METIGFKNLTHKDFLDKTLVSQFKKDLIFFDRILIPMELFEKTRSYLDEHKKMLPEQLLSAYHRNLQEIELLKENDLVADYSMLEKLTDFMKLKGSGTSNDYDMENLRVLEQGLIESGMAVGSEPESPDYGAEFLDRRMEYGDLIARVSALSHRRTEGVDALPLIHTMQTNFHKINTEKINVAQVVFKKFPLPGPGVDWTQIVEFRNDQSIQASLAELKAWMEEISSTRKDKVAIEGELELMMNRYREYMRVHEMEYNLGEVKTIVKISAQILGDLVKMNLGDVADTVFSIFDREVNMMKAEINAPGRQVAFLSAAKSHFED